MLWRTKSKELSPCSPDCRLALLLLLLLLLCSFVLSQLFSLALYVTILSKGLWIH